jgi:NAD-dependent dihydropyrimidine dehydrogenase PreA subunit
MPAKVEQENCDGCKSCVEVCPTSVIEMQGEKAFVKPEDCIECNACVDACTSNAMHMDS